MRASFVILLPVTCVILFSSRGAGGEVSNTGISGSAWEFAYDHALPEWQDGLPIGNGQIGAQCWGDTSSLKLTLDRGDVWDLRYEPNRGENYNYVTLREFVRNGQRDRIQKELSPDVNPLASRLPSHIVAGRLEIRLSPDTEIRRVRLDMGDAEVRWELDVAGRPTYARMYAHALDEVIAVEMLPADRAPAVRMHSATQICPALRDTLQYPEAEFSHDEEMSWCIQPVPDNEPIVVAWSGRIHGDIWQLLLTIRPQGEANTLQKARQTLRDAARRPPETFIEVHRRWWEAHWSESAVNLPDLEIERLWRNGIYKLTSASRRGLPVNLQGLWPPDGELPPWRGDYHCNMNVQEAYWPAYTSNHLPLCQPLNQWLIERVAPVNREHTRRFFGFDGLWIGTALDAKGRLIGGETNWMTVQYWLGSGAWLSQHLWWYYRYTLDETFLREKAYPFMAECMRFYENVLERDERGRLNVPLSSSPEYFSNELPAWTPNPTCDLSLIRNLAGWCIAGSRVLRVDVEKRERWESIIRDLAPYPVSERGLMVQPGVEYDTSHRHPIHLMPIWPMDDLTIPGSDEDRLLIERSIDNWFEVGIDEWTGWSFPYASLICTRVNQSETAYQFLDMYRNGFIWPNGFHVNGDYKRLGYSRHHGQVYTTEGELAFTAAVNDMLLQSRGNEVHLFPAVPVSWGRVSFTNLRAEQGILVSAQLEDGVITWLKLSPENSVKTTVVYRPGPDQPLKREQIDLIADTSKTIIKPKPPSLLDNP